MFVVSRAVARRAAAGLAPTIKQSKLQRAWESGSAAPLDKLVIFGLLCNAAAFDWAGTECALGLQIPRSETVNSRQGEKDWPL